MQRTMSSAKDAKLKRLIADCRKAIRSGDQRRLSAHLLKTYRAFTELGADIPMPPGAEDAYFDADDAIRLRGFGVTLTKEF